MAEPMKSAGVCVACGNSLPANAPGGLCPACLLRRGVELATRSSAKSGDFIPPAPDDLAVLFPEFEIVSLVGRGGMGAVYKAVQRDLERTVAIKLLPPETAKDAEFMERFRREATTLARLDHPGIVRLFDYGQRDDFAYFVMEFVDGVDLSQRMASGPLSPEDAFAMVSQLCDALQHSHERGVVHRDIKPANILIRKDGQVKLADFGLACLVNPDLGDLNLTRSNARLGTPRYMAPEQMSGAKTTDHRVDVYALGVVLYEMLTGHLPVGHFDPPSEKISRLTPRIDDMVLQALQAEPDRRFASMAEVKARLRDVMSSPGLTRPQRRRQMVSRALVISLIAAGLGVGAVMMWFAQNAGTSSPLSRPIAPRIAAGLPEGRMLSFGPMSCPFVGEPASAVAVSGARNEFGLLLRTDGTAQAWGDNRFGQANVPDRLNDVVAIAAGQGARSAHALALRADGTVVGWGDNTFAQAQPPAGLSNVIAIAAGEFHSLALTRNGQVKAWGHRNSAAIVVPENLPSAKAIAAGADFSLALLNSGQVVAWGLNDAGQCSVPQLAAPFVQIAAGQKHVVARLDDGRVVAWGDNSSKQCDVPGDLPGVNAVFAGADGSAALDQSGRLHVWGGFPPAVKGCTNRLSRVAIGAATWILVGVDDR